MNFALEGIGTILEEGKSKRTLDFEAKISLKEGLEEMILWTKENLDFIEACIHSAGFILQPNAA